MTGATSSTALSTYHEPMTKLREAEPASTGSAADFIPPNPTLPKLREAARSCRGCDYPFVGPAGKLLDTAMLEAGIDRTRVYVTNSVKHSSFVEAIMATVHPSAVRRPKTKVAGPR